MATRTSRLIIALVCAALALSGCGDDSTADGADDESQDAPDPAPEPDVTTSTTTTATTTTTTPATTAPDPDQAVAEATVAFESFFGTLGNLLFDETATYLENGAAHIDEFQGFADLAAGVGAVVTDVEVLDATTAIVTYDIVFGETVALPGSSGEAVLIDGQWLMSESTWSALAALAPAAEDGTAEGE